MKVLVEAYKVHTHSGTIMSDDFEAWVDAHGVPHSGDTLRDQSTVDEACLVLRVLSAPHFVLGAPDPEMEAIENYLTALGMSVSHACVGGSRVHPGNAYKATHCHPPVPAGVTSVICVECSVPVPEGCAQEVIDHHRPSDPGYGRPPSKFFPASSIGQVIAWLARRNVPLRWVTPAAGGAKAIVVSYTEEGSPYGSCVVPKEYVFAAAADHCLGAAYRGECPGVDPDQLMAWRAHSRANFQGRPVAEVLADIEAAKARVLAAPTLRLGVHELPYGEGHDPYYPLAVRDMRTTEAQPDARGAAVPELPEAALRLGEAYLAGPLATPDGRRKIVLGGARPEQVETFLHTWAPQHGLVDLYGDPERGFAGGYVS